MEFATIFSTIARYLGRGRTPAQETFNLNTMNQVTPKTARPSLLLEAAAAYNAQQHMHQIKVFGSWHDKYQVRDYLRKSKCFREKSIYGDKSYNKREEFIPVWKFPVRNRRWQAYTPAWILLCSIKYMLERMAKCVVDYSSMEPIPCALSDTTMPACARFRSAKISFRKLQKDFFGSQPRLIGII